MKRSSLSRLGLLAIILGSGFGPLRADDREVLSLKLPQEQQEKLQLFLREHSTPDRYVPKGAKVVDKAPSATDAEVTATRDKPIKQYTVQIASHRPVPGQEFPTQADVFYYRPNPEKGKQGITVKYTVDLATGKPVGEPEVMVKTHSPISREELAEAVALAKDKVPAIKELYKDREPGEVKWEYLQMRVNRKTGASEPGDRVVRLVFTANTADGPDAAEPVRALVNLTKDTATRDDR